ncbi:MAG TPA: hypothetical protein PLU94_06185 [Methanoregulaceae archaeon]|nr:hypothetical protein [Methanoregulaceae archaeon]
MAKKTLATGQGGAGVADHQYFPMAGQHAPDVMPDVNRKGTDP